jgi:ABC-type phosphate/phosphonate transport system substrate-binding protein
MKVCLSLVALLSSLLVSSAAAPAKAPTIVLVSGEFEYKSAETLPVLKQKLEAQLGAKCVYLARPADPKAQTIAGLEALDTADLAILYIRRMTLP